MTLNKVRVNLRKAASKPGVAFVALTRARHYDGLALDDSFPAMDVFQKQQKQKMFQKRQEFERCANALFSATIRRSMRDEAIYSKTNVWSQRDAELADALLGFVQARRSDKLTDADVPGAYVTRVLTTEQQRPNSDDDAMTRVWQRLLTQRPHMFAVARARDTEDVHPRETGCSVCLSGRASLHQTVLPRLERRLTTRIDKHNE